MEDGKDKVSPSHVFVTKYEVTDYRKCGFQDTLGVEIKTQQSDT